MNLFEKVYNKFYDKAYSSQKLAIRNVVKI